MQVRLNCAVLFVITCRLISYHTLLGMWILYLCMLVKEGCPGCNKILSDWIFSSKHYTVFEFSLIYNGGNGTISWKPSRWKTRAKSQFTLHRQNLGYWWPADAMTQDIDSNPCLTTEKKQLISMLCHRYIYYDNLHSLRLQPTVMYVWLVYIHP